MIQASLLRRSVSYKALLPGAPGVVEVVLLQQSQFGPALDPATLMPYLWFGFGPCPMFGFGPYHLWRTNYLASYTVLVGPVFPLMSWQNHGEAAAVQEAAPVGHTVWQAGSRLAAEAHTGHPVLPSFPGYPSVEPVSWCLSRREGEASVRFPASVVARGNLGEVGSRWSLPQGGVA